MLIQLLLIILFTVVFIFFKSGLAKILHGLLYLHHELLLWLGRVFSHGPTGRIIEQVAGLVLIPLLFGCLAAFIAWVIQRRFHPYVMAVTWFVWVILLVAVLSR